ncbi:MAG: Cys-tRNA(Pro) deacylase [Actinobacteria bacterium]|nr:MAG: Cys-tRNA(Pro) deacylase [Actinomycetota bacterium]
MPFRQSRCPPADSEFYPFGVAGQGTPATALLARQKVAHTVHEYAHDPRSDSYGTEAASALEINPDQCFKTLVAEVDGTLAVAVVPVSGSLDLKALAAALRGKRAAMADPSLAERTTGYVRGGISPLGQRKRLPTVVDGSAVDLPTMYVSAGRRGLEVELAPADLIRLTGATVARIAAH